MGDITTILDIFRFDPGVISEAFGVIACLSTLSVFVDTIGCVGVHRQVCFYTSTHSRNFQTFGGMRSAQTKIFFLDCDMLAYHQITYRTKHFPVLSVALLYAHIHLVHRPVHTS